MTNQTGIEEEIAASSECLELLKKEKPIVEKVLLSSVPFYAFEELEGKLVVAGIALAEGLWKHVLYSAEEIQKAAKDLKGKPLMVEHGTDEDFKENHVGKVLEAYFDTLLKSLVFKAEVTDPAAIKKVKDGTFPAVSCSTWVDKFPINAEQAVGFNYKFNELSLVRAPACDKCFILAVEELAKKLNKQTENMLVKKEIAMSETPVLEKESEVVEELEEDITELEAPNLYAVLEMNDLSDLEEDAKKRIVSYYYGYRYPYGGDHKYPYYGYPYYPYYPYKEQKKTECYPPEYPQKPEKKSLWVVLQLEKPEDIIELQKNKKVVGVYYGYYGYPKHGYPYKTPKGQDEKYPAPVQKNLSEDCSDCPLDILDLTEDYRTFMKKCMKEGKSMKECAKMWKKPEEKAAEVKCPEGQIFDEKEKKCIPQKEDYPAPTPEEQSDKKVAESGFGPAPKKDIEAGLLETSIHPLPGPAEIAAEMKPVESVQTETLSQPLSTPPVIEEVKKEEPKVVEEHKEPEKVEPAKAETTKETPIPEAPKETPKEVLKETPKEIPKEPEKPLIEPTKVVEPTPPPMPPVQPKVEVLPEVPKEIPKEVPKEIPTVETVKEVPKEEPKVPTQAELETYVKEHWAQILVEMSRKRKS
jgi:hypothetical protein